MSGLYDVQREMAANYRIGSIVTNRNRGLGLCPENLECLWGAALLHPTDIPM